jgi:hypothetical protein
LQQTATGLERIDPDAAAGLREGMKETLTVVRPGVHAKLRQTLSNTNVMESALPARGWLQGHPALVTTLGRAGSQAETDGTEKAA